MNKKAFFDFLISSQALKFGEFITKSGRESPYFINIGELSSGSAINTLCQAYANIIQEQLDIKEELCLFGPAYKGIPIATGTAMALQARNIDAQVTYARKEVKDHGEKGKLVGYKYQGKEKVIIIEDILTRGTSVKETVELLSNYNAQVSALIVAVDRQEQGYSNLTAKAEIEQKYGFPVYSLLSLDNILDQLASFAPDHQNSIVAYRKKYAS